MLLADGKISHFMEVAREFGLLAASVFIFVVAVFVTFWKVGKWARVHVDKMIDVHVENVETQTKHLVKQTDSLNTIMEQTTTLIIQHNDDSSPFATQGTNRGLATLSSALPLLAPEDSQMAVQRIVDEARESFKRNI